MGDRYINADALMEEYNLDKAKKYGNETREEQSFSYSTMMMYEIADMIDNAPTADVRPNVRSEWEVAPTHIKCRKCGESFMLIPQNFCPNCGADMRGEE